MKVDWPGLVAAVLMLVLGFALGHMHATWPRLPDCDKRPNGPYLRSDYAHCP